MPDCSACSVLLTADRGRHRLVKCINRVRFRIIFGKDVTCMAFEFCTQRPLSCEKDSVTVCPPPLSCENDSVTVCGEGIDGVIRTVRTDVNNVLGTLPSASVQSQIGRAFISQINVILDSQVGIEEFGIIIRNPSDTNRIMYINELFGGTAASDPVSPDERLAISISFRRDPPLGPGELEIRNLNFGFPDNSLMEATFTVDTVGGDTFALTSEEIGVSFKYDFAGVVIVPPDHSFGVRFLGLSNVLDLTNLQVFANVSWYELDL